MLGAMRAPQRCTGGLIHGDVRPETITLTPGARGAAGAATLIHRPHATAERAEIAPTRA